MWIAVTAIVLPKPGGSAKSSLANPNPCPARRAFKCLDFDCVPAVPSAAKSKRWPLWLKQEPTEATVHQTDQRPISYFILGNGSALPPSLPPAPPPTW